MKDVIVNLTGYDACESDLINVANIVFKRLNVKNPIFNIIIVDESKIQELNRLYRNIDEITDVISFAFEESDNEIYKDIRFLGEIYICSSVALKQSEKYNHSFKREMCYLCVHGILHLLGYDHIEESDKKIMRAMEEEVLKEYDLQR